MTQEPVAVVNSSVALVEAAVSCAVGFHFAGLNLDSKELALVMAVVVALGNLLKILWARGQVTPVSAPRNNDGQRLVPEMAPLGQPTVGAYALPTRPRSPGPSPAEV
ncbi:MAG TPA: hypothetical protein VGH98_18330 [Gemmatimonadaceae bacterium]